MRFTAVPAALLSFALSTVAAPPDYSKLSRGCWLGAGKFRVYHADGTWGVKRNEDAPEDTKGRRWRVDGNKLILTYPGDHGSETAVYTIVRCTERRMLLSIGRYTEEYTRYSADCQTEA